MTDKRLTILGIAVDSWRMTGKVLVAMPILFGAVMALGIGVEGALSHLPLGGGSETVVQTVLRHIWQAVSLATLAIATHRFVLLGESVDLPAWRPPPSYMRFFGWALVLEFLPFTVMAASFLFAAASSSVTHIGVPVVVIAVWGVGVRIVPLFPALAIESPYGTWRGALGLSKGHFWWIAIVEVVAVIPLFLAVLLIPWAMMAYFGRNSVEFNIFLWIFSAVFSMLIVSIPAAAASRIFQKLTEA